jgi:hypothetical protein
MKSDQRPVVDATAVPEPPMPQVPVPLGARRAFREPAWARHRLILLLAVVVLAGSFVLGPAGDGQLKLPLMHGSLPSVCAFKRLAGIDCPSCGLTRCFVWMSRGNLSKALDCNPVGVVVFFAVVAQLPYRAWQLRRLARGKPQFTYRAPWALPIVLIVAMFVQWLFGLGPTIQAQLGL